MKPEVSYVGIDVAQGQLDVAVRPQGQGWSVPNQEEEIDPLVARLKALSPALVVLEATGGLELPVVAALGAAGLPVVAVNPHQVRDFARATGKLAKTDRLDAQVLAHFAEALPPTPRPKDWRPCSPAAVRWWGCSPPRRTVGAEPSPRCAGGWRPTSPIWSGSWRTWMRS